MVISGALQLKFAAVVAEGLGKIRQARAALKEVDMKSWYSLEEGLENALQVREILLEQLPLASGIELRGCGLAWKTDAFVKDGDFDQAIAKLSAKK